MARKATKQTTGQAGTTAGHTALYIRVSTAGQAEHGYSLDAQRERLDAYCTAMGWAVDAEHVYIDAGVSGKTTERAAYQSMMAAAQAGDITRIVAVKLDRLSRNVRDFLGLVDTLGAWGCGLALLAEQFDSGTPQGRFALTMFASLAELERHTITDRMLSGKRAKAVAGGWCGGPLPYGYQWQGELTIATEPEQAATVRRVFDMFVLAGGSPRSPASWPPMAPRRLRAAPGMATRFVTCSVMEPMRAWLSGTALNPARKRLTPSSRRTCTNSLSSGSLGSSGAGSPSVGRRS
jgi:DNA invertase Pin-like site-specific DNA recombinase